MSFPERGEVLKEFTPPTAMFVYHRTFADAKAWDKQHT